MSLTIDEAIARFEANAEQNERWANAGLNPEANAEYAAEYRQLAAWLRELQERRKEPEKAQLSHEGTTKDAISRQAAIDALNEYFARIGKLKRRGLTEGEKAISLDTVGTIKTLPPAQPESEHTMEEFMYGQDLGSPEDGSL